MRTTHGKVYFYLMLMKSGNFLLAPIGAPVFILVYYRFSAQPHVLQLFTSSLAIHGGAIFSAISGRKSIPISAIEAPEHGACYRLLGFCLTITFCLIPAHQAVSY